MYWFLRKSPVKDLQEGRVGLVEGRVVARSEITVNGSGTSCVYYDRLEEAYETPARGRGRALWIPKGYERRCAGFFVEDATGRVWIAQGHEGLEVNGGAREHGRLGKKGTRRYTAQLLRVGDKVRVRGLVDRPKAAEPTGTKVIRVDAKGRLVVRVKEKS